MTIIEDEMNQLKGVVAIGYEVGRVPLERFDGLEDSEFEMFNADGGFDRDLARRIISIPLSIPVRPAGYHLCTDSDHWMGPLTMVMVTLCKFIRLRMRIHQGKTEQHFFQMNGHYRCSPYMDYVCSPTLEVKLIFVSLLTPHEGSDQECKYILMTHGIPVHSIPVSEDGNVDLSNHLSWVEHRKVLESNRVSMDCA